MIGKLKAIQSRKTRERGGDPLVVKGLARGSAIPLNNKAFWTVFVLTPRNLLITNVDHSL